MKNSKFTLLAFAVASVFAAKVAIAQDTLQSSSQPQMVVSSANSAQSNVTPSATPHPSTIPSNEEHGVKCYKPDHSYLIVNSQQECIAQGGSISELPSSTLPSATQPYASQ